MFTKRHEQELAEIKATTQQLSKSFEEILEQLERIKQNQDQLAAATHPPKGQKRKAERDTAQATEADAGQASSTQATGEGRAGRRQAGRKARAGGGRKRRRSRPGEDSVSTEE